MIKKGSKLYSIVNLKCPRCHEGDLFEKTFWKSIPQLARGNYEMKNSCPNCGLVYESEPGFWWGAMYIGYALSSGALLITGAIAKIYFGLSVNQTMLVVLYVAFLGFLINARLSRAIYINIYVNYQKSK